MDVRTLTRAGVSCAAVAFALLAAGCGDDEETPATSAGATGEAGVEEGAPYDITVGEFIAELQPQKQEILEAFVADSDVCKGVDVDNGFVLLVSAQSLDADQDAPLADLVSDQC